MGDADWLVNFRDVYPCEFGTDCKTRGKQCVDRIERLFRTNTGRQIALGELLPRFTDDQPSTGSDEKAATEGT